MNNIYNKIIFCIIFCFFSFLCTLGQNVMFQKIIEPIKYVGVDNLRSKDELLKKFFPDNRGAIEFLENPSFRGEYGFRMLKTDDNHYILEIKEVAN